MHRPESPNKRTAIRLSRPLEKKLIAYAAAASAAGMGVLFCSLPAEARVISTVNWIRVLPSGMVSLDLNNDGIPDFHFSNPVFLSTNSRRFYGTLKILPQIQSNAVWGTGGSASALGSGVTIGSNGKFHPGHELMGKMVYFSSDFSRNYGSGGPWKQATRSYVGFKFTIQGEIHYGWARMNVTATNKGMYGAVSEYAYETEPNKPIVTGQTGGVVKKTHQARGGSGSLKSAPPPPGSLGSLATGAWGQSARQKPEAGRE
jgi:hypothetical protein